jgi:Mn2+/Fe2+ NRAMP family transporter
LLIIVVSGKYWTFEKITLFFCIFNLVYIPAAFWAVSTGNVGEGWAAVGKGFYNPDFKCLGLPIGVLITLIMANIGTTITPWQIFFQQSAVVDKGMGLKHVKDGKIDTWFGSFTTCVVAAFIIIAAAAVFYYNPGNPDPQIVQADKAAHRDTEGPWRKINPDAHTWQDIDSAARAAQAMPEVMPAKSSWGVWAKVLFSVGLFDAGLLGALCISLATSWAMGEVFGWAHSLNRSVREAPWFYVLYLALLLSAGAVCLVTSDNVQAIINLFVQVVAVVLLPAALVFLILLLNDKPLMGEHVNTRWQNIANWSITIFVILASSLYGISVVFDW